MRELVRDPLADEAWIATSAVAELPAPRPPDLVDAIIHIAETPCDAQERALDVLADEMSVEAAGAQSAFLVAIADYGNAIPDIGDEGRDGRCFAAAALGLAHACPTIKAVEPVLRWLRWVTMEAGAQIEKPCWSIVGDLIEALAMLAPQSADIHKAVLAAVTTTRRFIDEDESGVLDFDRRVRRAFEAFDNTEEMFDAAERLGLPRVDPYATQENSGETTVELPDFPSDDVNVPWLEAFSGEDRQAIDDLVAEELERLGKSDPAAIATAVDRWLRRVQREGATPDEEEMFGYAICFGHAVAEVTGWQWGNYMRKGPRFLAVVSPDAAHAHLPTEFVMRKEAR